jgi:hypothetical protein
MYRTCLSLSGNGCFTHSLHILTPEKQLFKVGHFFEKDMNDDSSLFTNIKGKFVTYVIIFTIRNVICKIQSRGSTNNKFDQFDIKDELQATVVPTYIY